MKEKSQNRLSLIGAILNLGKIQVMEGKTDQLTLTYRTGAILEAQKVWMEGQLKEWYQELEKRYEVKIVKKHFAYNGQNYSLTIVLEVSHTVDWNTISDEAFRSQLFKDIRRYLAERIIKEYPLPFKSEANWDIPVAPNAPCKYVFSKHVEPPILDEKQVKIINSDKFQNAVKAAIEENDGVFVSIRISRIREEKYAVGYFEFTRNQESQYDLFTRDPLIEALSNVMKRFFKSNLSFQAKGEEDIT